MTARTFGAIADSVLSQTPGQRKERPFTDPVRKGSFHEDTPQAKPWRRLGRNRREKGAYVAAALAAFDTALVESKRDASMMRAARRRREDLLEESGRSRLHPLATKTIANEPLQDGDRRVLAYLLDVHHHATGECYPSQQTIANAIARSREAVIDSLRRLKRYGFTRWVRRTKTKEGAEGAAGPQLEQTSNAYTFAWETSLAGRALMVFRQILERCLKRIPPPPPRPPATITDPALAAAVNGLSASVKALGDDPSRGSRASGK